MKTLNEEVKEIMDARETKKAKIEKLVKIGLTNTDIRSLFYAQDKIARDARREKNALRRERMANAAMASEIDRILARYTFGVEIECYNVRPNELVDMAREKGVEMRSEGYNHVDNNRYYKLVSDASICGSNPIECVSPVLKGDKSGFDSLGATCKALEEVGAKVNVSTGLHVHVGGEISNEQYCNVFVNYRHMQNVIDTFMAKSRHDGRWAKRLTSSIDEACSPLEVSRALRGDRYYAVNPCSWGRHHTIEFRQHQGTIEYKKISMWAKFCIKLVDWSASNRLVDDIESIDQIAFLDEEEKTFFKGRANQFASTRN